MSESLPSPPPVSEPIRYRPLSAFAITGFAAACLFALLVVVVAVVALVRGEPFFYPAWVVLLPATALVLSLVGRSQIRGSEGTRAGEPLARWGIWVSVFTGLGYFVYYYVTGLAVTSQANAFLTEVGPDAGFFPHLIKGAENRTDLYTAFLLSLPTTQRGGVRPWDEDGMRRTFELSADGAPGLLPGFRNHVLVRLLTAAPPDTVKVEPLGVQSWEYENRSYIVRRLYRISTPEATVEFPIVVLSNEGETAGEPRRWFVSLRQIARPQEKQVKFTPLGNGLNELRANSLNFLHRWRSRLHETDPVAFDQVDQTRWKLLPIPEPQREYLRVRIKELFGPQGKDRVDHLQFPMGERSGVGDWKITADKHVQFDHPLGLKFEPRDPFPALIVEGRIVVETVAPVDPVALANATDLDWKVNLIEITRAGGPPAPPGQQPKLQPPPPLPK